MISRYHAGEPLLSLRRSAARGSPVKPTELALELHRRMYIAFAEYAPPAASPTRLFAKRQC